MGGASCSDDELLCGCWRRDCRRLLCRGGEIFAVYNVTRYQYLFMWYLVVQAVSRVQHPLGQWLTSHQGCHQLHQGMCDMCASQCM